MLSSVWDTAPKSGSTNATRTNDPANGLANGLAPQQRLWQRLRALRACTLTTRTPYGEPCSYPLKLQNRSVRTGEPLWFLVERGSDLAFDITLSPHVEIAVLEDELCPWTLRGRASAICDVAHAGFSAVVPLEALRELPPPDSEAARGLVLLRVDIAPLREDPRHAA